MTRWSFIHGGAVDGRFRRYLLTFAIGTATILGLAVLLFLVTPRTYASGFTLILPGAGPSSSVNLESLGQASSASTSPYSSQSLSPTENYKKLFQSYRVRGRVAQEIGLTIDQVPVPSIRLANQTKLIYIGVSAASPEEAYLRAQTWLSVFNDEVQSLRIEEQALREGAYRDTLVGFETAVEDARARIIRFQSRHGLISIEQFQDLVHRSEALKIESDEAATQARVAQSEIARLTSLMGLTPDQAARVMALQSDRLFQSLNMSLAESRDETARLVEIFGPNHPELRSAREATHGLNRALAERGQELLGFEAFHRLDPSHFTAEPERAQLVASLVSAAAALAGARERLDALQGQLADTERRVGDLSGPATELDGLLRDHQIAETVFASALARIDTNRTDLFASYPLTQIVEQPMMPIAPASPSKKLILLGTLAGLFLFTMGLVLLWIRLPVINALLKTL